MPSSSPRDPFAALAHPIRRDILLNLRDEPGLTAGAIAERFPRVSRAAVSRHLGVLRSARLIASHASGREAHYSLQPAAIAAIHDHWCARFEAILDGSLARLKQQVEGPPARDSLSP